MEFVSIDAKNARAMADKKNSPDTHKALIMNLILDTAEQGLYKCDYYCAKRLPVVDLLFWLKELGYNAYSRAEGCHIHINWDKKN